MSKPWIFVSPSSRGIGHALTRHLLRTTTLPILATARSDAAKVKDSILSGLNDPNPQRTEDTASRLAVLPLDVTDEHSIRAAAEQAGQLFPRQTHHLHLGFALPGILRIEKKPQQIAYDDALETLRVNLLGPLMLMKWFGDFLPRKAADLASSDAQGRTSQAGQGIPRHAVWLSVAARVGSTSDNRLGGWYSYRASKAGVISAMRSFDLHLKVASAEKAIGIAYHPGTVKTGLSQPFWDKVEQEGKLFSPEYAAERLMEVVARTEVERDRGGCLDWKGEVIVP
ncbi:short-chain dehydrogenase/reductase-like protein [Camillea tinctor]|nr:short-chain dehydrogenase/reductase-like protein [Camillea tinctor]